jgi:antitoxin ParD1/3/4
MKIELDLKPDQRAWLAARVKAGQFASIGDAASQLVASAIADAAHLESADLAWAKPLVEEAYASLERGEGSPAAEAAARIRARIAEPSD